MTICRFENRLTGQALVLNQLRERITACHQDELAAAFNRIELAHQRGDWIALLLDYELGEWLEPALKRPEAPSLNKPNPRLTALVFKEMKLEHPWTDSDSNEAKVVAIAPKISRADYMDRINQIREWIRQGDVYQINATFPMEVVVDGDKQSLYTNLANKHPVSYAAYIEDDDRTVLSFSPELFLQREGDILTTKPMKGTAPRAQDSEQDKWFGENLLSSTKNRAENLMIVDLLRNDLGRIAQSGSVIADPLFSLEKYPSVWTMTSTVTARLKPETNFESILRALFPCGSVTGAPKIAAMQRIQQTEDEPRGIYCGSIGWMAPNGDFTLNVAIRTLVITAESATYNVGGGIVYDSDSAQEWEECHWKARALSSEAPELIETMLANQEGKIERIEEHLNRLERSTAQLNYGFPGRQRIESEIQKSILMVIGKADDRSLKQSSDYRVRLLLNRSGDVSIETAPLAKLNSVPLVTISSKRLDSQEAYLQLKTTYRPWYASVTQWLTHHPDYFDLLFFNERDELCEGSRSNIYIKKNGQWITPPLSCGLLGGAVRQHLLTTRQVKEGILTRQDIEKPDTQIRLSNGLRGWFDVQFCPLSLLPGDFLP